MLKNGLKSTDFRPFLLILTSFLLKIIEKSLIFSY